MHKLRKSSPSSTASVPIILFTNGSDDALNFAFMAFCDESHPAAFPDITYGFYPVFAELNHMPYAEFL